MEMLEIRSPANAAEWDRYCDLRWRVLRAPWHQPRGSEQDELEATAFHVGIWTAPGEPLAVGRLHMNSDREAQVRYMAVNPAHVGRGLGSRILAELERKAGEAGAECVILNARCTAQAFYIQRGYRAAGLGKTLFGEIPHVKMVKEMFSTP